SALGGEFDIGAALSARVRAKPARFNRYFFECAKPDRHGHVEYRASALEPVGCVVDPVDGNVDGSAWQIVIFSACTRGGWRLGARHKPGEHWNIAAAVRQRQLASFL